MERARRFELLGSSVGAISPVLGTFLQFLQVSRPPTRVPFRQEISAMLLTPIHRKELAGTLISGPSTAASPKPDNTKWTAWLAKVADSKTIPDIYAWHQIGTWSREPDTVRNIHIKIECKTSTNLIYQPSDHARLQHHESCSQPSRPSHRH
jgi:hypothetical protein